VGCYVEAAELKSCVKRSDGSGGGGGRGERVEPRTSETVFTSCSVKSLPPVMLNTIPVARSMERYGTTSPPNSDQPRVQGSSSATNASRARAGGGHERAVFCAVELVACKSGL